jgi:hypothetical protein
MADDVVVVMAYLGAVGVARSRRRGLLVLAAYRRGQRPDRVVEAQLG